MDNGAHDKAIRDWVTVWHSEWAAIAVDRELHEAGQRAAAMWAGAVLALLPDVPPDAPGPARTHAPPRPAPAAAAFDAQPDARDAAIAALHARVEQLERRLAAGS